MKPAKIFPTNIICSRRSQSINGIGSVCLYTSVKVIIYTNRESVLLKRSLIESRHAMQWKKEKREDAAQKGII